jgi:hypothetical protein
MKKTIATTNKFLSKKAKKREMIVDAVYSSVRIEGSKTTKKELRSFYISKEKSSI